MWFPVIVLIVTVQLLVATALMQIVDALSRRMQPLAINGQHVAGTLLRTPAITGADLAHVGMGRRTIDCYSPGEDKVLLTTGTAYSCQPHAVAAAAHEIGHAVQHATGWTPMRWRSRALGLTSSRRAVWGMAAVVFVACVLLIANVPALALLVCATKTAMSAVDLLTEWDASRRADRYLTCMNDGQTLGLRPVRACLVGYGCTYVLDLAGWALMTAVLLAAVV